MSKKLAECLLRRKELSGKLERMGYIRQESLFKMEVQRVSVGAGTDFEELRAKVPLMSYQAFDAEYNHYARQLREIDARIQQMNWSADLEDVDNCFNDFVAP